MQVRFAARIENPVFAVTLRNSRGMPLFSASSDWGSRPTGSFKEGETILWKVWFENVLGPDRYTITPSVKLGGGGLLALREEAATIMVTRSAPTAALVDIPFEQKIDRNGPFFMTDQ